MSVEVSVQVCEEMRDWETVDLGPSLAWGGRGVDGG